MSNCCRVGQDVQRNPNCIRSSTTVCDLSSSLSDLKACYTADVLSVSPPGINSDLIEFPFTTSPRFCPYKDSRFLFINLMCWEIPMLMHIIFMAWFYRGYCMIGTFRRDDIHYKTFWVLIPSCRMNVEDIVGEKRCRRIKLTENWGETTIHESWGIEQQAKTTYTDLTETDTQQEGQIPTEHIG